MAKKKEEKPVFWWIYNQEEQVVGVAYAKTASGALAKFEYTTGFDRQSYRAEQLFFGGNSCAITNSCR